MSRVQSPNPSNAVRDYLKVTNPPDMGVLPAVLPVINVPFEEIFYFRYVTLDAGATGWKEVLTVPADEDWFVYGISATKGAGDGHMDYVGFRPPSSRCKWGGSAIGTDYMLFAGESCGTALVPLLLNFYCPVLWASGTVFAYYEHDVGANDGYEISGWFLRRKW